MTIMTFCDKTNIQMGCKIGEIVRPFLPELSKNELKIPGRQGTIDLGNNTYTNQIIEVEILINEKTKAERIAKARKLAAWLSQKGELSFDDEPGIHYIGRIYSAITLENLLIPGWGKPRIVFDCEPFGYSDDITTEQILTSQEDIIVENNGTIDTPMRIILKNTGDTTIEHITLMKLK